jgi:hypothetical protein
MPKIRKVPISEAEAAGWEVIDRPHSKTFVLVAADPTGKSNKLRFSRRRGIPAVTLEECCSMTVDGELLD